MKFYLGPQMVILTLGIMKEVGPVYEPCSFVFLSVSQLYLKKTLLLL